MNEPSQELIQSKSSVVYDSETGAKAFDQQNKGVKVTITVSRNNRSINSVGV